MPPIDVHRIVNELQALPNEATAYLNTRTGELFVDLGADLDGGFERDDTEVPQGPEWAALPDRFELHEWERMRDFAQAQRDPQQQRALLTAIRGRGAFRAFRAAVERMGLLQAWYQHLHEAYADHVRRWLRARGLAHESTPPRTQF